MDNWVAVALLSLGWGRLEMKLYILYNMLVIQLLKKAG